MKKSLVTIATALTLASALTFAADPTYYGGVDLGFGGQLRSTVPATYYDPNSGNTISISNDSRALNAFAYGVHVGVLTPENSKRISYGVELGFTNYGSYGMTPDNTGSLENVQTASFNYLGVIKRSFENGVNILGKAGVAYVMETVNGPDQAGTAPISTPSSFVPLFAVGAEYDLAKVNKELPVLVGVTYQAVLSQVFTSQASLPGHGNRSAGDSCDDALMVNISYYF